MHQNRYELSRRLHKPVVYHSFGFGIQASLPVPTAYSPLTHTYMAATAFWECSLIGCSLSPDAQARPRLFWLSPVTVGV